jgi:hypothetical protein
MATPAFKVLEEANSVGKALLPTLFNMFEQWGLTGKQQMVLLGLSNEKTLYNWKNQPEKAKLSKDTLERCSYLLGIYKSLQILLPDPELADAWLTTPNDHVFFNASTPLSRMLAGQVIDLAEVRHFLDAERAGW